MSNATGPGDATRALSGCVRVEDGVTYRDLNGNGRLDVYEDPRRPVEQRVEDLLAQMTLEEKAGLMFMSGAWVNSDGSLGPGDAPGQQGSYADEHVTEHRMTHFNVWAVPAVSSLVRWHNNLQRLAEEQRLGIPVTIASDPRNHFSHNIFDMVATEFSQWPNAIGFGAIGDADIVRRHAAAVREEYLAVGFRMALHPQADLATEPRWPRIPGTFGEDAGLAARLTAAYIEGLQGPRLGPGSVACMTKHFPGAGPQNEGLDAHFEFHKGQVYPGGNFDYHLIPFEAAFAAGTAAIMPYYGVPIGQTDEDVAFGYNKAIITGLARQRFGFDGIICTDWGLVTDVELPDTVWPARAWGVENLSRLERVEKVIDAGCDQFGGEHCPEFVIELVRTGRIAQARIDESARRLLALKFRLGLFDDPFVDPDEVDRIFGRPEVLRAGEDAQKQAMTLLKNDGTLPLASRPRLYVENISPDVAAGYSDVVERPQDAEVAVLRLDAPWYPVDTANPFALDFHHGDLDFRPEELARILSVLRTVPSVVVMYMDRPAVIPEIAAAASGLIAEYGATDRAVLDVVFGRAAPGGRLPFELPSSMDAVRRQRPDVPHDSPNPLFPFGHGLTY